VGLATCGKSFDTVSIRVDLIWLILNISTGFPTPPAPMVIPGSQYSNFIPNYLIIKIKSLFNLKDENRHKSNVIYRAECTCGETYIGEIKRNFAV